MRKMVSEKVVQFLIFCLDFAPGALIFSYYIGKVQGPWIEVLALVEMAFVENGANVLAAHIFIIVLIMMGLRSFMGLLLGRSLGEMAMGMMPIPSFSQRLLYAFKNLSLLALILPFFSGEKRRRASANKILVFIFILCWVFWPWPFLQRLNELKKLPAGSVQITEVKIDINKVNLAQGEIFESTLLGLEAIIPDPHKFLIYPCLEKSRPKIFPSLCFFELEQKQIMTFSIISHPNFDPAQKRYHEFQLGNLFRTSDLLEKKSLSWLVQESLNLSQYDGIRASLVHGPFLEGIVQFRASLDEIMPEDLESIAINVINQRYFLKTTSALERNFYSLDKEKKVAFSIASPSAGLLQIAEEKFLPTFKFSAVKGDAGQLGALFDFILALSQNKKTEVVGLEEGYALHLKKILLVGMEEGGEEFHRQFEQNLELLLQNKNNF